MHCPLNPIMLGLLALTLPGLAGPAEAAERGLVLVNDAAGATQLVLGDGDTATYAGTGATIDVSVAGNTVRGAGITVTAGSASARSTIGVRASAGGNVTLSDSAIKTLGDGQGAHALAASGAGSVVSVSGSDVSTQGTYSHGAYAQSGGRIELDGGTITTTNSGSRGLSAEGAGSVIVARDVVLSTAAYNAGGAYAENGASITLHGGKITTTGNYGDGISVRGANALVSVYGTEINVGAGVGARLEGGRLVMDGGSLTAGGSAVMLSSGTGAASSVDIRNATLTSTGDFGYGININAKDTSAVVENVSISALGYYGTGVWLPSTGTSFTATGFDIASSHLGVDNRAGQVTLVDGTITTRDANAHGLYVSREYGSSATIKATKVNVKTRGDGAVGVLARASGAAIELLDASVTTEGASAYGLFASGSGARLSARNTQVSTSGANATGLSVSNRAAVTLDNTGFTLAGAGAHGIWSYVTAAGVSNTVTLRNGSRIDTQDGVGLLASGGGHTFLVSDSDITARAGGDVGSGVLLHSRAVTVTSGGVSTVIESEQVTLDATNARLTGDVLADSGTVDVSLANGSTLNGALVQRGTGRINGLTLDGTSTWTVRGDSSLATLSNAGTVAFAAPAGGAGFKTLTVNNYVGGGTLVLNTQLGDDASPTDKLVIDGGTTSGNTALRIVNAGGSGGQTIYGIRVVETINGGTTTADAFHLDSGSTGYRASARTVSLNGYDYSLVRGGNGAVAPDWYLTSDYTPPVTPPDPIDPTDPTAPGDPTGPVTPPDPVLPGGPGFKNVSPESGAYAGNRLAATRLFTHSLHDRVPAYADGDADARHGRGLWARVQGRHDSGLRMSEGRVDVDTDSAMVQLGGDLLKAPLGREGALYAGLMGGYGDARSRSVSTLMLPGATQSTHARARGKVSGYAGGVYGTFYANDLTRLGAYADTWIQYGRYTNQVSSELGSARYRSNVWSASLEGGYALKPFAAGSALEALVIEPNAQLVYSRYRAQDATLQGTRMRSGDNGSWQSRVGVRLYPQVTPRPGKSSVRPFLETNWLHRSDDPTVRMGSTTLQAQPSRNALELKVGAEGRVGKAVQVSGHLFGQTGSGSQHGYGGMLNVSYRW